MIRTSRILFCDQEHGTGEQTFPSLRDLSEQDFIRDLTAKQLRAEAKKAGWSHVDGHDYCGMCTESNSGGGA